MLAQAALVRSNMVAKNDITGDAIQSKSNSREYENNFDRIFRKTKVVEPQPTTDELVEFSEDWQSEKRATTIAQNGNVGYSLEDIYAEGDKDYGS